MVSDLSERWIESCRNALERIRKISSIEEKDRLELVKSIRTSLILLGRSLSGWNRWVSNPSTMARFSRKELEDMESRLSLFAESFIEYDLKTTKLGSEKGLERKSAERKQVQFVI